MLKFNNTLFNNEVHFVRKDFQKNSVIIELNHNDANMEIAKSFQTYLINLIDKGIKKIIIDFNKCKTIDSTFIGALVMSLKCISKVGGKMVIVFNDPELPKSTIFVVEMQNVFKSFTDINQAICYLNQDKKVA